MIDSFEKTYYTRTMLNREMENLFRNIQKHILDDPSSNGWAHIEVV